MPSIPKDPPYRNQKINMVGQNVVSCPPRHTQEKTRDIEKA